MSQKSSRKGIVHEDKDKPHTDTPVKEMKKKMAANAEKEKQAAEKNAEKQTDKSTDKNAEKATEKTAEKTSEKKNEKPADNKSSEKKADKPTDKSAEKKADKLTDKSAEKKADKPTDKSAEKKADKPAEKKSESQVDKSKKEENTEGEKSTKEERRRPGSRSNGRSHNGDIANGDDDDLAMVVDDQDQDQDQDELFPELTYEESDVECFEPPTPEGVPSRSFTRRSQAKAARTPETPRPASDKQVDKEASADDVSTKKSKEDAPPATDRKLRSADSPKPDSKKAQEKTVEQAKKAPQEATKDKAQESPKKGQESPKKSQEKVQESAKKQDGASSSEKKQEKEGHRPEKESDMSEVEVEVMFEVEGSQDVVGGSARKPDTNYSKSRVKVSPYRRSSRLADITASSLLANYTGNNSTMEMDITEMSSFVSDDASVSGSGSAPGSGSGSGESPYLSGLRSIRGRRSYKPLKEMALRHVGAASAATTALRNQHAASEVPARPTGTVVGRKRKPEGEAELPSAGGAAGGGKRMRLLDRLAHPFRRTLVAAPLPRRAPEIVGINTDLPLTAPVAAADTFDPETLKLTATATTATTSSGSSPAIPSTDTPTTAPPPAPRAAPGPPLVAPVEDKRCIVM